MGDVRQCRIVNLPHFQDHRGSLTFVEPDALIPFVIQRVYYLYQMPPGSTRGGHGHRRLEQLIIAVSGSFSIELADGYRTATYQLSSPDQGLYVSPMIWRILRDFTEGTVCLVLASQRFDDSDYFRDYSEFMAAVTGA
jgi:dTDP-4-dehydrorhamnose 3,5-epimerase-like enzyme